MILQRLYEYYQRKANCENSLMPPLGMAWKEFSYLIIIKENGEFVRFESTIEQNDKSKRGKKFLVPKSKARSGTNGWQIANSFWDNYEYVLGHPKNIQAKPESESKDKTEKKKNEKDALNKNSSFIIEVENQLSKSPENKGFRAVSAFYKIPDNLTRIKEDELWTDITKNDGTNLAFKVISDSTIVADQPELFKEDFSVNEADSESYKAICLITGKKGPIRIKHTDLILPGGNTTGSKIVGFQKDSGYDSYYKKQGANAPVSLEAESTYSTALNEMLDIDSKNKFRLGDTTILFWAQQEDELEEELPLFFTSPDKDNPDKNIEAIRNLYNAPYSGRHHESGDNAFYILGLTPNTARIAIKFWKEGTVTEIADNIRQHFLDIEIIRADFDDAYYPLFSLLTQITPQKKMDKQVEASGVRRTKVVPKYKIDKLPPNLMSDVFMAVINNTPYPATLLNQCINRIRADRNINRKRSAILKAYLNRKNRITNYKQEKEITMALDLSNTNQAYLCGRLFAVLEKIQEKANPELNATIKDRYYGSASTTPIAVFSRLIDLSMKHLSKMNQGASIHFDKLLCGIIANISSDGFPVHLSMEDQARFAIGYYHQRQELFKSSDQKSEEKETNE